MPSRSLNLTITFDKVTSDSYGLVCIEARGRYRYFAIDEDGELSTREKEYTKSDLIFCKAVAKLVRKTYIDRVGSLL